MISGYLSTSTVVLLYLAPENVTTDDIPGAQV